MQGTKRLLGGVAAIVAVFSLGACGGESDEFNTEQFESEVVAGVQEPPQAIEDADSADCGDVAAISDEVDSEFTCTVTTTGGEEYEVIGIITSEAGEFKISSQELAGGATGAEGAQ